MKRPIVALALAAMMSAAQPTLAAPLTPNERAAELAREGLEKLMQALQLMIQHIPQYEPPVINENGDIIIKRKRPGGADPAPKEDGERNI